MPLRKLPGSELSAIVGRIIQGLERKTAALRRRTMRAWLTAIWNSHARTHGPIATDPDFKTQKRRFLDCIFRIGVVVQDRAYERKYRAKIGMDQLLEKLRLPAANSFDQQIITHSMRTARMLIPCVLVCGLKGL